MGRPKKTTIDYFPHIIKESKTIFIIESKFGNDGYAFWFKLLEILGNREDHVLDTRNPFEWEFLVAKTKVNEVSATEILDTLSKLNAIDQELWKNKVIWSSNFVNGIADVYKKRQAPVPQKPSFCDRNNTLSNVSGDRNNTSPNVSDTESTQSKVKESKVNKKNIIITHEQSKEQNKYIVLKDWPEFVEKSFRNLLSDLDWVQQQEKDYPGLNIERTMEKEKEYWSSKKGWNNKGKGNSNCDWKRSMNYAFGPKGFNRVFKKR